MCIGFLDCLYHKSYDVGIRGQLSQKRFLKPVVIRLSSVKWNEVNVINGITNVTKKIQVIIKYKVVYLFYQSYEQVLSLDSNTQNQVTKLR